MKDVITAATLAIMLLGVFVTVAVAMKPRPQLPPAELKIYEFNNTPWIAYNFGGSTRHEVKLSSITAIIFQENPTLRNPNVIHAGGTSVFNTFSVAEYAKAVEDYLKEKDK